MPGRLAASVPVIATLVLVAGGVEATTARAEDCLASPNSPAPKGSWWYYRLDSPTQRKCWYLRALGAPAQQTVERATGQPPRSDPSESARPSDSTDDSTPSLPAADTATLGSIVQEVIVPQATTGSQTNVPIAPSAQNDTSVVSANSREGKTAVAFPERPVQETSESSQPDAQTAAANAEVASPDAVPRIMAHAASTNAAASVPDEYVERVVRSRKLAANEQPPIFFFVVAVGLAAIGIVIHLARRLRNSQRRRQDPASSFSSSS
jgi:hypothetical protein